MKNQLDALDYLSTGINAHCIVCQQEHGMTEEELENALDNGDIAQEAHFSWASCEACGSSLGGDREPAHGLDANREIVHLDVCMDCVQKIAGY
jgi:hypothetical protein